MNRMPWVERRFDFTTPAGLFPSLLERLRGTPARAEDLVASCEPAVLRRREGNSWSIQENLGHLLEVEALWHGRLDDYEAGLATLRAADMENRRTRAAEYNSKDLREVLAAFRTSRSRLLRRLEGLDDAGIVRAALHPRLGQPMRLMDMVVFAAEHDDHHLARARELLRLFDPDA